MMRMVFSPRGMLLGGILTLLLSAAAFPALAEKDRPKPDPMADTARRLEEMRKLFEDQGVAPLDFPGLRGSRATMPPPRLGVELTAPSDTLADQLGLPRDRGLVVRRVLPDSAAARAGLKSHDILLELNGQPVPSKIDDFRKSLATIEANKPVAAVVMRKGKRETLQGLKLPEAKAAPAEVTPALPDFPRFEGWEGLRDLLPHGTAGADRTVITRNGDQFTATRKHGKHTLTVKGAVDYGKAKVQHVTVDDGDGPKTYEGMDKVPAAHRKAVEDLAATVGGKPASEDY